MKVFLCLFLSGFSLAWGQIERVEPPNWWANMRNSSIELMLYGTDLGTYEVESKDLLIQESSRTENLNYLWLTLDLSEVKPGSYPLTLTKEGAKSITLNYPVLERSKNASIKNGFDSSDVIYLLMPDRFANGDPSNDEDPNVYEGADRDNPDGRHGGDLQGIINNLDYIEELGATALWLTPVCEDNDKQVSYHTYAQSDLYRIDPRFGTNETYKTLAQKLHEKDMKIIMDYVTNHWGIEHWMMEDLPSPDWIHQFENYTNTNHRKEIFSDPYKAKIDYDELTQGWFVPTMPDLNQSNPKVLTYLTQNAIWWIEYANLDSFRVDTFPYNDPEPMTKWVGSILNEYPGFTIVGEGWMHSSIHTSYWQKDSPVAAIADFNSQLPSVMDFPLTDAIGLAFKEHNSHWEGGTTRFYKNFQNDFLYPNIDLVLNFAENHDTNRINDIYPEFKNYAQVMVLLATIRGIPQIYYGSELGMAGKKSKGDGDIRQDFPGGWPGDKQNAFVAEERTKKQKQYFDFTAKLLQWRKNKAVIHKGKTLHFIPQEDVYVYFRILNEERVMVVLNNNSEAKTIDLNRFKEGIQSFLIGIDVLSGKQFDLSSKLSIGGEQSLVLELN